MIGNLHPSCDRIALVSPSAASPVTYAELHALVRDVAARWTASRRQLVFLRVRNDLASVLAFLSLREAGHVVVLVDQALAPELFDALVNAYHPDLIVSSDIGERAGREPAGGELMEMGEVSCTVISARSARPPALHDQLALCLTTSGSTGSPKLVRLSETALTSNARAIASALDISCDDRAVTCLPLHYAYGLSILTSHLAAGASVVLSADSVMDGAFWSTVRERGVTSLAGVPYTYEMLERLGYGRVIPSSIRTMTQAGGRLSDAATLRAHAFMSERGGRFHVMYGQTEATARMAVLPHEWLPDYVGCAGRAIQGGTLAAYSEAGEVLGPDDEGELVYRGPNVMLGYATTREDLALGDVQRGVLHTGDLGVVSATGVVRITGRLKRMGKLFGVRVDLDMLETLAGTTAPTAIIEGDNAIIIFAAGGDAADIEALRARIASRLQVKQRVIDVRRIAALPRTSSGKVDYPTLRACA